MSLEYIQITTTLLKKCGQIFIRPFYLTELFKQLEKQLHLMDEQLLYFTIATFRYRPCTRYTCTSSNWCRRLPRIHQARLCVRTCKCTELRPCRGTNGRITLLTIPRLRVSPYNFTCVSMSKNKNKFLPCILRRNVCKTIMAPDDKNVSTS